MAQRLPGALKAIFGSLAAAPPLPPPTPKAFLSLCHTVPASPLVFQLGVFPPDFAVWLLTNSISSKKNTTHQALHQYKQDTKHKPQSPAPMCEE